MCRSIKTLRPPYTEAVTEADMRAAALQYVRKVSGMQQPSQANQRVFDAAVKKLTRLTLELIDHLEVHTSPPAPPACSQRSRFGRM